MIYKIKILEGIENIRFGDSFKSVREHFSSEHESFVMGGSLESLKYDFPVDFYKNLGIFSYFDKKGNFEALEFTHPAQPIMNNIDILALSKEQAVALFLRMDPDLDVNVERAISRRLSIGIVFSLEDYENNAPISSILVGCPGYYDGI